jgi:uncharacterized repeat protein (TIGR03803 family)
MNYKKFWGAASAALMIVIAILMLAPAAGAASKYKVLYKFGTGEGGPLAGVTFDQAGNLYGTTYGGSAVFKLTRSRNGNWREKLLHFFNGNDGSNPAAGLIFDQAGNLYGTTEAGGGSRRCRGGCGVVFKLTRNPNGSWKEKVLHQFGKGGTQDGANPNYAGLIFDQAGNLYGTTTKGGATNHGVVFKLTPNPDGSWTETVLYSFKAHNDGSHPYAGVIFDQAGNLYGTTAIGGAYSRGTVFELTPNPDGSWAESVLYTFTGNQDGGTTDAGLIFDQAGNLYGTTAFGGASGAGTVFELTPNPDGSWTETVLYSFKSNNDGSYPHAGVIFDQAGNLYGTTINGGVTNGGVVFKLTPNPDGSWTETVLYSFSTGGDDGTWPAGNLIFDQAGNLYGTTNYGGSGDGVVFKLTP